jgi:hypothetical protein
LVWSDVEALVGFPANEERNVTRLNWVVGSVQLTCSFPNGASPEIGYPISTADLTVAGKPSVNRDF